MNTVGTSRWDDEKERLSKATSCRNLLLWTFSPVMQVLISNPDPAEEHGERGAPVSGILVHAVSRVHTYFAAARLKEGRGRHLD